MKKIIVTVIILGLISIGCASSGRYNTQKGAALGAGLGALAGQAIGHNTEATLIGTGVGTLLGTIVGNGIDQQADEYRDNLSETYTTQDDGYYGQYNENETALKRQPPPGKWVVVPGHWEGRRWVPPHEVWKPIDPR